ncbi:MAG: ABC transporter substrate-binding protein [Candidatus Eisenbacteria bacterium]
MSRLTDASRYGFALTFALLLAAPGCGRRSDDNEPHPGGTLTIAQRDSFATFDPAFAWDPESTPYLDLVFEGLVAFDDSGRVRPACAREIHVSPDGLTYRFVLRPGLRYADGSKVAARDFAYGLGRLFRTGALRSPGAPQFVALEGALDRGTRKAPPLGATAPDSATVELRLAWRDPFLLEKLAQPRYAVPVPESLEALLGASYGAFPATNGPYALERLGRDTLLFVRNAHFDPGLADARAAMAARGFADTIRVLTHRTARQTLLGLESGRVQLVSPPPLEYADRLARTASLSRVRGTSDPPVRWILALNAELAPVAKRDVRQAVAWGLNRQRLVEEFGDYATPVRGFAHGDDGGGQAPGYDPARARQFLEAAKQYTGVRVAVTVPRASTFAAGLDALTTGLARASIQVDGVALPRSEWARAALARRGAQAILVPWQSPSRDDLDGLAALLLNRGLRSGWAGNVAWYHPDSGLDSLLLRGLRQPDPVSRQAIAGQVGTLLESDVPFLPLAGIDEIAVVRAPWTGAVFHPRRGLDLRRVRRGGGAPTS